MTASLSQRIVAGDFGLLFYWPQHDQALGRIWNEPGTPGTLDALLDDRTAPLLARVVAAEVLFRHDLTFLDRHDAVELARVYVDAMVGRHAPNANLWGLLWINDSVGELGGRLLVIGAPAIGPLRAQLGNETVIDWYEGSEAATLGNGARYRIKDVAAYYLARITGRAIAFHTAFRDRDAEIAELIRALDAGTGS